MKQKAHTRWQTAVVSVFVGLLLSSPMVANATVDAYSRTPSGAEVEVPPGLDVDITVSALSTGTYLCIYVNYNPSTTYFFPGGGQEITSSPDTFLFEAPDIPVGEFYEVAYARYSNPGCSTGYIEAVSLEYDAGATLFEVIEAPPAPDTDVATTTPDAFPQTLFFGFLMLLFGVLTPVVIGKYIDHGN